MTEEIKNDGLVVYCSKGNVIFTSTGEIEINQSKIRKHNKNRNIVYPVFEELKKFNESPYWDNLLTRFSKNLFPRNFKFYNSTIYWKSKRRGAQNEFYVDPNTEEKETLFKNLVEFLEDKGLISVVENKEKSIMDYKEDIELSSWKDFSKNQFYLIEKFEEEMAEKYNLNEKELVELSSVIKFGLSSDILNNSTIIVENYKIKEIKTLIWDETKRKFTIDNQNAGIKFSSISKKQKDSKYSSHKFSDDVFLLNIKNKSLDITQKWKVFLSDYYK